MKDMERLKSILCDELEQIASKQELSAGDLDTVHKLTDTIKNIDKICMLEDGYSETGDWNASGNSYANRHYVRGHYSRDDGRQRLIEQMESMMRNARGEEREAYRRAIEEIRRA